MAYNKTNWQDTLRDAQGNVIQKGTPLNAQALGKIEEGIVQAEQKIDTEIQQVTTQLAQSMNITTLLGVKNDGTQDISLPLQAYAQGRDEIYIHFPKGRYRWDNNTKLTNKRIRFTGDNAVIEHYGGGANLDIGDVTTRSTVDFFIQGIDFVNKKPKPATNGSGVSAIVIGDCVKTTIRDVNIYDVEQYGILLRRANGILGQVVLDNVNVYRCSGTLATTTSIALETRAASGEGKIGNLKISNCYFEVTDTYVNDLGGTTAVTLSNASKLQACDEIEMVNVTFVGGKENGTLTFAYDTKKVKMTNVVLKSNSSASKGITISYCPNLELDAVNCELGLDNFVQSIGINDSLKKAKFVNCKLGLLTKVSGTTENFEFNACEFILRSTMSIRFDKSIFNNCSLSPSSTNKNIIVAGNNNRLVNFVGIEILEVSGNDNKIIGGDCTSLRPNGASARGFAKGVKATSADRALHINANTVSDWIFEDCTFERTVGGGTSYFGMVQGLRNKVLNCTFRQLDKTATVGYAVAVINATDCEIIEKKNNFDVNKTASYAINVTNSTGTKQYLPGDTFVNGGKLQMWDGAKFIDLTTTTV